MADDSQHEPDSGGDGEQSRPVQAGKHLREQRGDDRQTSEHAAGDGRLDVAALAVQQSVEERADGDAGEGHERNHRDEAPERHPGTDGDKGDNQRPDRNVAAAGFGGCVSGVLGQ
ncbi:hypothetical protein ACFQER_11965 [Halomicroarcula sp. GCM10025894]|uniref:hypothetical protein n=1 Tax=Halomicroarcula sp. GCM10025894 TaxID=3252673 RepID=UPI00360B0F6C